MNTEFDYVINGSGSARSTRQQQPDPFADKQSFEIRYLANPVRSTLSLRGKRVAIDSKEAIRIVGAIFEQIGCSENTARLVAGHAGYPAFSRAFGDLK